MWLRYSRYGPFLDDGGSALTHNQSYTRCFLPFIWHHGYWICLHGLHVNHYTNEIINLFILKNHNT